MDEELFSSHVDNEGWSDAEDPESSLSFGKLLNARFIFSQHGTHYK